LGRPGRTSALTVCKCCAEGRRTVQSSGTLVFENIVRSWAVYSRRRRLGTNELYLFYYFAGSKIPSKAPPRGPESTPRAQKRGPRAIPNPVCRKYEFMFVCLFSAPCQYAKYPMLRNSVSGPEIGLPGRILAGLLPGEHRHRPSGRPSDGQKPISVFSR
jgi:hypothetical protein